MADIVLSLVVAGTLIVRVWMGADGMLGGAAGGLTSADGDRPIREGSEGPGRVDAACCAQAGSIRQARRARGLMGFAFEGAAKGQEGRGKPRPSQR